MSEGSRDQVGDSVVVQKPAEKHKIYVMIYPLGKPPWHFLTSDIDTKIDSGITFFK